MPVTRTLLYFAPTAALIITSYWPALASGFFDVRGLAVGLAVMLFNTSAYNVGLMLQGVPAWKNPPTEDGSVFAGLVRWLELCDRAAVNPPALLRHEDGDPLCPCPLPGCGGNAARASAALRGTRYVVQMLAGNLTYFVFIYWTPAVFLATETWTVAWRAVLMAYVAISQTVILFSMYLEDQVTDVALVGLDGRLEVRAIRLSLVGVIDACVPPSSLLGSEGTTALPAVADYVALHQLLGPKWRSRVAASLAYNQLVAVVFLCDVFVFFVSLVGAGCAPAWILAVLLWRAVDALYMSTTWASCNAHVAAHARLYARAAQDIRLSIARGNLPTPPAAQSHLAVLDAFAAPGPREFATAFGVPVTFGFVRGAAVTIVTVAVGLFGILRGAGARATVQSFCPVG
ncbi:hypothetical protein DFJ74DRAFT_686445 [Hyaloraphidium curvatum]|nr:hypothetical protein DFJ74DRAFT_686445 [Hyaloraphidium curvatum]